MSTNSYVSIRDDSGVRSLSNNERDFLRSCALARDGGRVLRGDGRGPGEVRKVRLNLGRWHNGAECTVQWGTGTRVTALVTAELLPPSSERPSEGTVSMSVDLSPMASSSFGHAQPLTTTPSGPSSTDVPNLSDESQKLLTNRILRCLERTLLVGGALDTEALCVQSGEWVWRLNVHVTVLDHGGNLMDASVLAAVAALRHYRKPQVDFQSTSESKAFTTPNLVHSDVREPTPLPIHHTPLSITFALIHADDANLSTMSTNTVAALVDPTDREELVQTGTITIAMNVHSEVCLLDFGGGCELKPAQLKQCWKLAQGAILQLCKMLEETLQKADEKAHQDRLNRLVLASKAEENTEMPPPDNTEAGVAYLAQQPADEVDTTSEFKDVSNDVAKAATQLEEEEKEQEAYRIQALDYALGHVAAKVKENADNKEDDNNNKRISSVKAQTMAGSLLAAMLQSAQGVPPQQPTSTHLADTTAQATTQAETVQPSPTTTSLNDDVRSQEAVDEFDQFAKQQQAQSTKMELDSDEEDTTMMLQSEFQPVKNNSPSTTKATPVTNFDSAANDEDDIDDLAMAITKKKKKKKAKK